MRNVIKVKPATMRLLRKAAGRGDYGWKSVDDVAEHLIERGMARQSALNKHRRKLKRQKRQVASKPKKVTKLRSVPPVAEAA